MAHANQQPGQAKRMWDNPQRRGEATDDFEVARLSTTEMQKIHAAHFRSQTRVVKEATGMDAAAMRAIYAQLSPTLLLTI